MRDLIVSVPDHCLSFYFAYAIIDKASLIEWPLSSIRLPQCVKQLRSHVLSKHYDYKTITC